MLVIAMPSLSDSEQSHCLDLLLYAIPLLNPSKRFHRLSVRCFTLTSSSYTSRCRRTSSRINAPALLCLASPSDCLLRYTIALPVCASPLLCKQGLASPLLFTPKPLRSFRFTDAHSFATARRICSKPSLWFACPRYRSHSFGLFRTGDPVAVLIEGFVDIAPLA